MFLASPICPLALTSAIGPRTTRSSVRAAPWLMCRLAWMRSNANPSCATAPHRVNPCRLSRLNILTAPGSILMMCPFRISSRNPPASVSMSNVAGEPPHRIVPDKFPSPPLTMPGCPKWASTAPRLLVCARTSRETNRLAKSAGCSLRFSDGAWMPHVPLPCRLPLGMRAVSSWMRQMLRAPCADASSTSSAPAGRACALLLARSTKRSNL